MPINVSRLLRFAIVSGGPHPLCVLASGILVRQL